MQIKIKYLDENLEKVKKLPNGDWYDLRSAVTIELKKGDFKLIPLGIIIKLPPNCEAHVVPRSSTFKNFSILQVNSQGVIDESYCGPNDQWFFPALAMRDTKINFNDRICQFRVMEKQETAEFVDYDDIEYATDRNGFGSTGVK